MAEPKAYLLVIILIYVFTVGTMINCYLHWHDYIGIFFFLIYEASILFVNCVIAGVYIKNWFEDERKNSKPVSKTPINHGVYNLIDIAEDDVLFKFDGEDGASMRGKHRGTRGRLKYVFSGKSAPVNNILLLAKRLAENGVADKVEKRNLRTRLYQEVESKGLNFEAARGSPENYAKDDGKWEIYMAQATSYFSKSGNVDRLIDEAVEYVTSQEFVDDQKQAIVRDYRKYHQMKAQADGRVMGGLEELWIWFRELSARHFGTGLQLPKH